jgi:hypothetical protein
MIPFLGLLINNPIVKWGLIIIGAVIGYQLWAGYQQSKGAKKYLDQQKEKLAEQIAKGTQAGQDVDTGSDRDKRLSKEYDRDAK